MPELIAREAALGSPGPRRHDPELRAPEERLDDADAVPVARATSARRSSFGGGRVVQDSNPMQLARVDDSRRLVLTVGNFSILDFFDKNTSRATSGAASSTWPFLTYAAYDFAADARGYAWGGDRGALLRRLGVPHRALHAAEGARTSCRSISDLDKILRRPGRDRARPHAPRSATARCAFSATGTSRTWGDSTTPSPPSQRRPVRRTTRRTRCPASRSTTARPTRPRPTSAAARKPQRQARHRLQHRAAHQRRHRPLLPRRCTPTDRPRSTRYTSTDQLDLRSARSRSGALVAPRARHGRRRLGARLDIEGARRVPGDGRRRRLHRRRPDPAGVRGRLRGLLQLEPRQLGVGVGSTTSTSGTPPTTPTAARSTSSAGGSMSSSRGIVGAAVVVAGSLASVSTARADGTTGEWAAPPEPPPPPSKAPERQEARVLIVTSASVFTLAYLASAIGATTGSTRTPASTRHVARSGFRPWGRSSPSGPRRIDPPE